MAYTDFVEDKPDITDDGDIVINNTRENLMALRDALVCGALNGWDMDITIGGGSAAEPDEIIYKKSTEWLRLDITWGTSGGDDGNPTVIVYAYSANSGGVYDTIGTATMTYDSGGAMTDVTWS